MRLFTRSSPSLRKRRRAQALIEFTLILPVMLLMTLGLIDLGRAFVFGVAVQEGTRQAARVAARANYDSTLTDAAVLGRLVAASNPALGGCTAPSSPVTLPWTCGVWTASISVVGNNGITYASIAATPRTALAGAQVTVTAAGSVALLPGVSMGMYGLQLPQLNVQGQTVMVIL